ncbi:DUF2934 domain-containing protein [Rhizobium sp. LEGMi198b]|uniref:DUF2934 domain-containing protein n=1 Tax=unclassified Rhizobium TaxID=2613769 RepID=UPI000CDF32B2|nr:MULTISPECIES: DUF2934 domain-containing protein [Rhizobium]AVA25313.1 hypothetical protein NXC24_PC00869 [Rhizobium sp. NXC24]MDK4740104.1 DUF2934 domain-containing protein [Rhizobium sp. CNPSo 3464]UWU25075.1 DUF2934 domain-containing protein [Rhizobium tropici]
MLESRDEWIKKRAYAIWEEEGYPSGRDTVHWEQASSERIALEKKAGKKEKVDTKPKTDSKPKIKGQAAAVMAAAVAGATAKAATKRASKKTGDAKI